jgi:hypothetical protein
MSDTTVFDRPAPRGTTAQLYVLSAIDPRDGARRLYSGGTSRELLDQYGAELRAQSGAHSPMVQTREDAVADGIIDPRFE